MARLLAATGIVNIGHAVPSSSAEVHGTHTTGTVSAAATALTVASGSGISDGDFIIGEGITPGTTVASGGGTVNIVLSANANVALSADLVSFYTSSNFTTPGVLGGMLCRAWVNFNGTGTLAIRASYNVSSVDNIDTADYRVNFTTAMPSVNFVALGTSNATTSDYGYAVVMPYGEVPTTAAIRLRPEPVSGDSEYVFIAIFA